MIYKDDFHLVKVDIFLLCYCWFNVFRYADKSDTVTMFVMRVLDEVTMEMTRVAAAGESPRHLVMHDLTF